MAHNVVSFTAFLNINEIEPSKLSSVWRAADHYSTNRENNLAKIFLFTFLDFGQGFLVNVLFFFEFLFFIYLFNEQTQGM